MASKPIGAFWYCVKLPLLSKRVIGIVAVQCEITGRIKFYIGIGSGKDEECDQNSIYKMGVPFHPQPLLGWIMELMQNSERIANE